MLRWKIGPFGLKDVFTVVNLLSGVVAVRLAFEGELRNAGYAVLVGFLLGDILDGAVARATRTANRFGAELDTLADHFVHVFVPGLVMLAAYQRGGHTALGMATLAFLVIAATVRHARFAAAPFRFPPCWCGLPRTVSGFVALSYPLSTLFRQTTAGYLAGFVLVAGLSVLNLVPIPYMTHRGERPMPAYVKVLVAMFLLGGPILFVVARRHTFDVILIGCAGFALTGWVPVQPDERRRFYVEYRRWAAELAS
jgi:CDP-diacylglycerol--serine O-phosphatidyltransferase